MVSPGKLGQVYKIPNLSSNTCQQKESGGGLSVAALLFLRCILVVSVAILNGNQAVATADDVSVGGQVGRFMAVRVAI